MPASAGYGRDPRCEHRRQHHEHDEHGAERGQALATQTADQHAGPPAQRDAAVLGDGLDRAHERAPRTRGSMSDCRMSTSRLAITYASATNSVTPRIAGVSSDWIAATAYEPSPGQL